MTPILRSLLAASLLALAFADHAAAQTIYLRIHAVRLSDDDGTRAAAITPAQVAAWVKEANAILGRSNAGIRLYFKADGTGPDWQEVKSTVLNRLSSGGSGWSDANSVANKESRQKPRDEVMAVEPPAPQIPSVDSADQSKAARTAAPRPKPPFRIPPPPPAARPGPRPNR
jgi:hypothetical protein